MRQATADLSAEALYAEAAFRASQGSDLEYFRAIEAAQHHAAFVAKRLIWC
jgi:hypothetical protein